MSRIVLPRRTVAMLDSGPGAMHIVWFRWIRAAFLAVQERLIPTEVKTAAYSASAWDAVMADPNAVGAFTVTLPEKPDDAIELLIKNVTTSTNTITVAGDGDDTIDESATLAMTTSRQSVHLLYSAAAEDWRII